MRTSLVVLSALLIGCGGSGLKFVLTGPFNSGQPIPARYTSDGENVSPELHWSGAPEAARSFALICDDPDAPGGTFTHWVVYNIPGTARGLPEAVERTAELSDGTRQGSNGFGGVGYSGPKPPPGTAHRYFFRVYALGTVLGLGPGASEQQLQKAMTGHVLARAEFRGTYQR